MRFKGYVMLFFVLNLSHFFVLGQSRLPTAVNFKKAYVNGTRNFNGMPGKNYWQNTANYQIDATLNPATNIFEGKAAIEYFNNSPDTLKRVVLKLYPNLYQRGGMRNTPIAAKDIHDGLQLQTVVINGNTCDDKNISNGGTNLYLKHVVIAPGAKTHIEIQYSYPVNHSSFMRTGQVDSGTYVIAYFFPRVAVYDDIDGWNEYPYLGKEEFYNDYCNFDVHITMPGRFQIWATGELMNPGEVYQPDMASKLALASCSNAVTDLVSTDDLKEGKITRPGAVNTWHFKAGNVTDFAFMASDHYVWKCASVIVDSASRRRTRVDAVFNPAHQHFEPVIQYAKRTVELISCKYPGIPFPYTHITMFEGLDAMEYPMLVNDLPFEGIDAVQFTAHEIFHTLFPFFVGTNETKYSFMDEGWATWAEFTLASEILPEAPAGYDLSPVNSSAGTDQDMPVMTLTPQLYGKARFSDKDLKPALALHYVREMLGDDLFFKAIRYYITQWQGKHPTPYDFFYCMNKDAGIDMNWFWNNWFFEKVIPDLAIDKVSIKKDMAQVTVVRKESGIVPVHLTAFYKDGSTAQVKKTIACWRDGHQSVTVVVPVKSGLVSLQLGNTLDADINPGDNQWHVR